jgi:phosphoenolpyruvate---glycerone phosphotransferase subunit DhaM
MIALVIVSHSHKIAEGVKDLSLEMSQGRIMIATAGGVDDQSIGTNADRIHAALTEVIDADGVLVLLDLGSAIMSTEVAIEMLEPEQQQRVLICDAPLVEGSIIAAIEASMGHGLEEVNEAAKLTTKLSKLQ